MRVPTSDRTAPFVQVQVRVLFLALALALAGAAGCRSPLPKLDLDPEVSSIRAKAQARPGKAPQKLALAPLAVEYGPKGDLERDSSRYPARVDAERIRAGLRDAIAASTRFEAPHLTAVGADPEKAFAEAFQVRADILVRPALTRLDCVFRGRNGRYVPNLLLWLYAWVPSFWVPDEDFALDGELRLEFVSVASQRLLFDVKVPIDVEWPLDDFERGWSVTGVVTVPSSLEPDDWGKVADSLAPLLQYELEKATALAVAQKLEPFLTTPEFEARDATVFALVIGLSKHRAGFAGPAGGAPDARHVAEFLAGKAGVPAKNVRVLADDRATRTEVEGAAARFLARARPRDTAVVYWSGLGASAGAPPERYLLPYDADPAALERTAVPLARLRDLLAKVPARQQVAVLDVSFDGRKPGGRALVGGAGRGGAPAPETVLERSTQGRGGEELTLLVGCAPGEDAIDLEGATRGLLTYMLLEGATGKADDDKNGVVSWAELQTYLEREVTAQAGLDATEQSPRLYRRGRRVAPLDPSNRGPWLPNAGAPALAAAVAPKREPPKK